MDSSLEYKASLIKSLHKSTKLCQKEFVNKIEVVTENNSIVSLLVKEWEIIFYHGLKKRSRSVFSMKTNLTDVSAQIIQQIKPFNTVNKITSNNFNECDASFWPLLTEFLGAEDIYRFNFNSNSKYDSDINKGRAWIRTAINEHSLEMILLKLLSKQGQIIVRKYYESFAILLDPEQNAILPNLAAGISSIVFSLNLKEDTMNKYPNYNDVTVIRSQITSTSSSTTNGSNSGTGITNGTSFNSSFDDVEVDSGVIVTNSAGTSSASSSSSSVTVSSSNNRNSKYKNRVINILPIDDDDNDDNIDVDNDYESNSESSELYSPFNLFKTGLNNFVTKFQFGTDEKLTDIKEHHTNLDEDDLNGITSPDNEANKEHERINMEDNEIESGTSMDNHFQHCRLSLKSDFYDSTNQTIDVQHIPKKDDNINGSTEDALGTLMDDYKKLEEIVADLKRENETLKQENKNNSIEFKNKNNQVDNELKKLNRENELLRNRLKAYLVNPNFSINNNDDKQISSFSQFTNSFSNELAISTEESDKISQLTQMHADLVELNYQLQRSLVDKDVQIGMLQSKLANLLNDSESTGTHIDGLGAVHIDIRKSIWCGKGSRHYLCYSISTICTPLSTDDFEYDNYDKSKSYEWTTYRRYKEFHKFYQQLSTQFPNEARSARLAEVFPSKILMYRPSTEQLDQRQRNLEKFLNSAVSMMLILYMKQRHNRHSSISSSSPTNQSILSSHSYQSLLPSNICNIAGDYDSDITERIALSKELVVRIIPFLAENPMLEQDNQ